MNKTRSIALITLAISAALSLAACSTGQTSESHGSRVKLYSSTAALASDSSLVVVGTVASQRVASDIDPVTSFTISTLTVDKAAKGSGVGPVIEVRQIGSTKEAGPAPLLEPGRNYLLYLTASGLSGKLASQYYVTGGAAGIYSGGNANSRTTGSFSQVENDAGDSLPAAVTLDEALG